MSVCGLNIHCCESEGVKFKWASAGDRLHSHAAANSDLRSVELFQSMRTAKLFLYLDLEDYSK